MSFLFTVVANSGCSGDSDAGKSPPSRVHTVALFWGPSPGCGVTSLVRHLVDYWSRLLRGFVRVLQNLWLVQVDLKLAIKLDLGMFSPREVVWRGAR